LPRLRGAVPLHPVRRLDLFVYLPDAAAPRRNAREQFAPAAAHLDELHDDTINLKCSAKT
jgi:hypothetical protein